MRKLIVTGMPRSGTSWLGQIINSLPEVSFRTEPLFSYRFKNIIDPNSTRVEVNDFFDSLVDVDDHFILQKQNQEKGIFPVFDKTQPEILAFKTTRHFELLERYLEVVSDLEIIAIVRHPCAVINSWFKSYREFEKKGCQQNRDWKSGGCRKNEVGEYWGFDDWIKSTKMFLDFSSNYPNFQLVRYSDLVRDTEATLNELFGQLGIGMTEQTRKFISECHMRHDEDTYSVFKSKQVLTAWCDELERSIATEIINQTSAMNLSDFLD